ncbi:MAG: hypothetical protein K2L07_04175 [Lachnospiraceae bacterium]|nr:hypothetical protein [Lachnospiraceae bacterium]
MREKIARIFVYIYVFFATLNRRLSIVMKKRLAEGICAGTLVLLLMISLLGSGVTHSIPEEQMMSTASVKKHNTVTNKNTTASIEIHNSEVAAEKTDYDQQEQTSSKKGSVKRNVVSPAQTSDRNAVVENPVPLSQVQALYRNNGIKPLGNEEKVLYQYPVEIGYAIDFNYDGKQTKADYLLNDVFETRPEKDNGKNVQDVADSEEQTQNIDDEESNRNMEDGEEDPRNTEDSEGQAQDDEEDIRNTEDSEEQTQDNTEKDKRITASIQFQKNIWNAILPTSPIEKSLSEDERKARTAVKKTVSGGRKSESNEELPSSEEEADDVGVSEDQENASDTEETEQEEALAQEEDVQSGEEEQESEEAEQKIVANAGYFTVRGSMRTDVEAFVGDITIEPTGIKGFNQVRIGEDGEFGSAVTLTKDAADEKVTLYFSNGSQVTTGVDFTYSKDTVSPVLTFDEEGLNKLQGDNKTIYCTNDSKLNIACDDDLDGTPGTGIDKLCYVYGDKLLYVVDHFNEAGIQIADDFYGRILMNCTDKAGNASDVISKYYLMEQSAPEISMAQDAICTTPYTLWVDVADKGHIISGIEKVECSVNGESYDISDLTLLEEVVIDKGIEVPSKYEFSLPFTEEGEYDVVVTVTDHAGNVSVKEQTITVEKPELVSVFMPQQFTIHIDPQQILNREQIFSDDITLVNNSEFDVKINIKSIELAVKDEVSDTGVKKDCNIYLVAPDTGEKILINKGNNKNVYSYCLPEGADGDISTLLFVGETTEGSDEMWESTDITINMELGFEKWREGEK